MATYPKGTIQKVLEKSNNRCFYCGESFDKTKYEIDHLLPYSIYKNGTTKNLVASCKPCNRTKSDHGIQEFRELLEVRLNIKVVFFFEKFGIEITDSGTFYKNTLNVKTYTHG